MKEEEKYPWLSSVTNLPIPIDRSDTLEVCRQKLLHNFNHFTRLSTRNSYKLLTVLTKIPLDNNLGRNDSFRIKIIDFSEELMLSQKDTIKAWDFLRKKGVVKVVKSHAIHGRSIRINWNFYNALYTSKSIVKTSLNDLVDTDLNFDFKHIENHEDSQILKVIRATEDLPKDLNGQNKKQFIKPWLLKVLRSSINDLDDENLTSVILDGVYQE